MYENVSRKVLKNIGWEEQHDEHAADEVADNDAAETEE